MRPRAETLPAPFGAVAPRRGGAPDACCRVGAGDTGVVTTTPGPNFCELGTAASVNLGRWRRRTAGRSQKHAEPPGRPFEAWLHFQARSHVHANSWRCARVDSARRSHACSVLLAAASLADLVPLCRCHREDYGHLCGPKALSLSPRVTRRVQVHPGARSCISHSPSLPWSTVLLNASWLPGRTIIVSGSKPRARPDGCC